MREFRGRGVPLPTGSSPRTLTATASGRFFFGVAMGTRGPRALPANVHILRGNPSKKPLGELFDELRPEVEIPDCPSWIWSEAKKEWKRVSAELEKYGLISKLDR